METPTVPPARPSTGRPIVCGHRGASAAAPENTLAAYRLARQVGAEMIELDTQLSEDGVPIVMHDGAVDRTTNGTGAVNSLTLEELRCLDAGSWKDPRYAGEKVPTLEEVFQNRGDLLINVEIKAGEPLRPLVEKVVRLIGQYALQDVVMVSSFSAEALAITHELDPSIKTAIVFSGKTPETLPPGVKALHPHFGLVTAEYVQMWHAKGLEVNPWTVNEPADLERMAGLGVDTIFTDVPDKLAAIRAGNG